MNEQTIVLILTVVGSVYGFYLKIKKDIVAEQVLKEEPVKELNISVIKLNQSIEFLNQTIQTLKENVANHGKEITKLKDEITELKLKIQYMEGK